MEEKYYVDACIWRDFYEDRSDKFRPLGEFAFKFLCNVRSNKNIVFYSDLVVHELNKNYSLDEIKKIFSILGDDCLLFKTTTSKFQVIEAKNISRERCIPSSDSLHAVLARDNNATLVTRDAHFECVKDIFDVAKPEDLI